MVSAKKSNSIVTYEVDAATGSITFNVLGAGSITFDPRKAHKNNRDYAESHGWVQRVVDSAAIPRDPKTGKSASPKEKHDAMLELVNHYESGTDQWRITGTGEGRVSYSRAAIAEYLGVELAELDVRLDKLAEKRKIKRAEILKAVSELPQVLEIIARMRAERVSEEDATTANEFLTELGE